MSSNVLATFSNNIVGAQYTSLKPNSRKEQAELYNAISDPMYKVSNYINKDIWLKDVYIEVLSSVDEITGEESTAVRIVLIDANGDTYQASSRGIFNSIKRLAQQFGEPSWVDPIPVTILQKPVGENNRTFVLRVNTDLI